MLLKYFYDKQLAQASYMVGCVQTGEALVIDPARDVTPYLEAAAAEGLKITHVTETHIHADYVSGNRELASHTGARIYLSDTGTADWKYGYTDQPNVILVRDHDSWMVGNVRVEVLHTPGHTPEHISFMITDTAGADKPIGVFTGDFLFVGDVGRPDLLEEAAGFMGTKEPGARQQFRSVQRFKDMPDYLQIWPGHGAGSACGKALGAVPSTTLGYEKLFNPAFQYDDEDRFVAWLLDGQPEAPKYFARMKHVNKVGPALLREVPPITEVTPAQLQAAIRDGALVVDFRDQPQYSAGHIPGTVNIPANDNTFSTYVGWFVDYSQPMYLIAAAEAAADTVVCGLRAIGIDNIAGAMIQSGSMAAENEPLPVMNASQLAERARRNDLVIVDVRGRSEYLEEHIRGARHIPLGYLPDHLNELPRDHTIVTHCVSGYRSQIAASLLRKNGFSDVYSLNDQQSVWSQVMEIERA